MGEHLELILVAVTSIGASSGFWAYMTRRSQLNNATIQLLLGLAHDRIIILGMQYKERGWITKDEYEDYLRYLCEPYKHFGGNGLANKIMDDVSKLPLVPSHLHSVPVKVTEHVFTQEGERDESRT